MDLTPEKQKEVKWLVDGNKKRRVANINENRMCLKKRIFEKSIRITKMENHLRAATYN